MSVGTPENPPVLDLCDLVAPSGVGYSELATSMGGRAVVLQGMLIDGVNGTLLVTDGAGVNGCEHEAPAATVALIEPSPALRLLPRPSPVRLVGIFEYGFDIDEHRTVTFVRLRSGRLGV